MPYQLKPREWVMPLNQMSITYQTLLLYGQKKPPVPPNVNDGRITSGNPNSCAISFP